MTKLLTIEDVVSVNPLVMSGMPVFHGTRIPLEALYENLAAGMTVEEILDAYPTLDRSDVIALLALTPQAIAKAARSRIRT